MIEIGISEVSINFGFKKVLNQVDIEIQSGDKVGIVGDNGSGKSTIMKIITGQVKPDHGAVFIRKGATIGFLEQIPPLENEGVTVQEIFSRAFEKVQAMGDRLLALEKAMAAEPGREKLEQLMKQYASAQEQFISIDGYGAEEKINKIVKMFSLAEVLDREFNHLSGGQKTVVQLAAVLLKEPDILLLDEPTNHLDIHALEWLEGFLSKYSGTVVIISHDRYFLDKTAQKTVLMEDGAGIMYHGNYSFSIAERERQLLAEFAQYKNQQKKIEAMEAAIKRFREWGKQGDNKKFFIKAKELEKRLEKMELMERPQMEKKKVPILFSGDKAGKDILVLKGFSLSVAGLALLEDTELKVVKAQKVCLLGKNGTGKTTLISCILNHLQPRQGDGTAVAYRGGIHLNPSASLGYIPQEIRFQNERDTVLTAFRKEFACLEGEARNILAKYFFYGDSVFKQVSVLSGGEKVLLKLAVLMQQKVNFLVLDEPTNHIDIGIRELLEEALQEFSGTLLFVSHDRYFINKIATRMVEIKDLKLHSVDGNYDRFLESRRN